MSSTLAPISSIQRLKLPRRSLFFWWHLLSLDAPTVAVVWGWSFAHAFDIPLPWFSLVTLGLGTWCVYIADRLLDGYSARTSIELRERHLFYAQHRRLFFILLLATTLPLTYFLLLRVAARVRTDDTLLAVLGLVYFALIHGSDRYNRSSKRVWLPKEISVGVLFAIATAVPTWSRIQQDKLWMLLAIGCFACICSWNCVAIQIWEDDDMEDNRRAEPIHRLTAWLGLHLRGCSLVMALFFAGLSALAPTLNIRILLTSCSLSGVLFLLLNHYHHQIHRRTLRVAVDIALLMPLLWIAIVR